MIREFFSIEDSVYFINDQQKIACGYISEVFYNAKEDTNSGGFPPRVNETVEYVIDGKFRRNGRFVFKSRNDLIDSL